MSATTVKNSIGEIQKLKIELQYDLAIPLPDIYPKKMKALIQKDTYTPIFIAASFIIAKIQKEAKCPTG